MADFVLAGSRVILRNLAGRYLKPVRVLPSDVTDSMLDGVISGSRRAVSICARKLDGRRALRRRLSEHIRYKSWKNERRYVQSVSRLNDLFPRDAC